MYQEEENKRKVQPKQKPPKHIAILENLFDKLDRKLSKLWIYNYFSKYQMRIITLCLFKDIIINFNKIVFYAQIFFT